MVVPRAESSLLGLFLQFLAPRGRSSKVSLRGSHVRLTEVGQLPGLRPNLLSKDFWRPAGIGRLVEYPEKTDRLEQRQAAGETPQRPFCALSRESRKPMASSLVHLTRFRPLLIIAM